MNENAAIAKYQTVPHKQLNLGFERFLVYLADIDKRFILSTPEYEVLRQCRTPASFEAHLTRICSCIDSAGKKPTAEAIGSILRALMEKGLLVEQSLLLPRVLPAGHVEARISSLAFVTADRPSALVRSVQSYTRNFQTHNRELTILVMDDSKSMAARLQNLQGLRQVSDCKTLRYSGAKEKQAFVEHLAGQGIDPAIAGFALAGMSAAQVCTTGANRNCVLLDTLGELVLTADDDTICAVVPHPERDCVLRLGNHENPREVWFCASRAEISPRLEADSDLLAEHELLLGRTLRNLVSGVPQNAIAIERSCTHLLAALSDDDAAIVVTIPGMAGDSGAGCAQRFLLSSRQVWTKLNWNDTMSRLAFSSREVLWVSRSSTITHSGHCQAAGLGIANNRFLPPFSPLGRNQDGVFGVLNLLDPTHFSAHLPIALFHSPENARNYEPLPPFRIANLIISLIDFLNPVVDVPLQKKLRSIGQDLIDIADLPLHHFRQTLFAAVSHNEVRTLHYLDPGRRKYAPCSAFVRREVDRYRDHILSSLMSVDCCIPTEFRSMPIEVATDQTRQLIRNTGSLFCSWPDMIDAARYLKDRGIRLSRSILELDQDRY